jgi:hypothetical protein
MFIYRIYIFHHKTAFFQFSTFFHCNLKLCSLPTALLHFALRKLRRPFRSSGVTRRRAAERINSSGLREVTPDRLRRGEGPVVWWVKLWSLGVPMGVTPKSDAILMV